MTTLDMQNYNRMWQGSYTDDCILQRTHQNTASCMAENLQCHMQLMVLMSP
jgi:hypothetical protein